MGKSVQNRVVSGLITVAILGYVGWRTGPFLLQSCGINVSKMVPEEPVEVPLGELHARYANTVCAGLLDCFGRHDAWGEITVQVSAAIDAAGKADQPLVEGAPAPVARCIEREISRRRISGYTGGGGSARCRMSGTYMEGTQMIVHDFSYTPNPESGGGE